MSYVITAHQSNFLFAASIISKIQASDALILLDEVQFTKNGWTNRNKLSDGRWLTVPVERHCAFKPINRVRIGEPAKDWREPVIHGLVDAWPGDVTAAVCREILRPYKLLVGLNVAILDIILGALAPHILLAFQSHLAGGHAVPVVSDDKEVLKPISWQLASMVAELGGDVYLSGPSGKKYLSEEPFEALGIAVEYWHHEGPNPCALALVDQHMEVAA
jgi:hypothetical protein